MFWSWDPVTDRADQSPAFRDSRARGKYSHIHQQLPLGRIGAYQEE